MGVKNAETMKKRLMKNDWLITTKNVKSTGAMLLSEGGAMYNQSPDAPRAMAV
jgi:hypothetical protein